MEILKNQNLLVLGTEGIEINKEVQDQFEVRDREDLQVTKKEKVKVQGTRTPIVETPSLKSPI